MSFDIKWIYLDLLKYNGRILGKNRHDCSFDVKVESIPSGYPRSNIYNYRLTPLWKCDT